MVVKFRHDGLQSEGKALNAWRRQGARVPRVMGIDTVPSTVQDPEQALVEYMLLETIVGQNGKPAPDGHEIVKQYPECATQIGTFMGEELAIMHTAYAEPGEQFGYFGDFTATLKNADTWNEVLTDAVGKKKQHLLKLGYVEQDVAKIQEKMAHLPFQKRGIYLHGDWNPGSVLVQSVDPFAAYGFDPNPLIGVPEWDYAKGIDRVDRNARLAGLNEEYAETNRLEGAIYEALFRAYEKKSGRAMDPELILACQIGRNIIFYDWLLSGMNRRYPHLIGVTQDMITEEVDRFLQPHDHGTIFSSSISATL
jgi:hypothetical protein